MPETTPETNCEVRPTARLWCGLPGPRLTVADERFLSEVEPGGVVLFARNLVEPAQTRDLCAAICAMVPGGVAIAVDEEGGRVTRFSSAFQPFPFHPGARAVGDSYRRKTDEARRAEFVARVERAGQETGEALRELGITVDLAPCVDLEDASRRVLALRSFGADVDTVVALGAATVRGLQAGGVHACVKHYPGLGVVARDPHFHLPREGDGVHRGRHVEALESAIIESAPTAVMTSHFLSGLDSDRLVTFSPRVVGRLRRSFSGAILSDDLEMGALRDTPELAGLSFEETVSRCADAGHDVFLVCESRELARRAATALGDRTSDADRASIGRAMGLCRPLPRSTARGEAPETARPHFEADRLAREAITVVRDPGGLWPPARLDAGFCVVPGRVAESPGFAGVFEAHGVYGERLDSLDIAELVIDSLERDPLLVVFDDLEGSEAQRELMRQVSGWARNWIALLVGHPEDAQFIPKSSRATVVLTHGSQAVHWRALEGGHR